MSRSHLPILSASFAALAMASFAQAAALTAGNLVVYRTGTGASALSNAATAVYLDEYTTGGTLVQSFALPTSGTTALTATGTATSEGAMSLSSDGNAVIFTGYRRDAGLTGPSALTGPARVVGTLTTAGTISTATAFTASPAAQIRGATSADGTSYYASSNTSVHYLPTASSTTATTIYSGNLRQTVLSGGQLFASSDSSGSRLVSLGSSPTSAASPVEIAPSTALGISGFAVLDLSASIAGPDTIYAVTTSATSVVKYRYDGTNWAAAGSIPLTGTDASSAANISALANGDGSVTLYLTNTTKLSTLTDTTGQLGSLNGTFADNNGTLIKTAGANTAFRGVVALPVPEPTTLGVVAGVAIFALRRRRA